MPADKPKVGTGRRRQGGQTEPDRNDDSQRARERAIDQETDMSGREHDRGWDQGAHGDREPPREKPGTRVDLEDADIDTQPIDGDRAE